MAALQRTLMQQHTAVAASTLLFCTPVLWCGARLMDPMHHSMCGSLCTAQLCGMLRGAGYAAVTAASPAAARRACIAVSIENGQRQPQSAAAMPILWACDKVLCLASHILPGGMPLGFGLTFVMVQC